MAITVHWRMSPFPELIFSNFVVIFGIRTLNTKTQLMVSRGKIYECSLLSRIHQRSNHNQENEAVVVFPSIDFPVGRLVRRRHQPPACLCLDTRFEAPETECR